MAISTRRKGMVVGLVLAIAAGAGIALAAGQPGGDPGAAGGTARSGDAPAATEPSTSPTPAAGAPIGGEAGAESQPPAGPPEPGEPAPSPLPDAVPEVAPDAAGEGGTEVLPPVEVEPDVTLPTSEPFAVLVPGPAPATDSERGGIVAGFPSFLQPAPDSTVESSMVTSENGRMQAALTASTTATSAEVQRHFDAVLTGRDLQVAPAPAVGGSTAWAYSRGAESVTLTLTERSDGGADYSLLAILDAAG